MALTRFQKRAAESNGRARYRRALEEIREMVSKRQLPITNQVFEVADKALKG